MPTIPHKHHYQKHPEFEGIGDIIWDALNEYGSTIPDIGRAKKLGDKKQLEFKDNPIWHTKTQIDKSVESRMNLNLDDYGKNKSSNPLYKAIAGEIGHLRKKKYLIDWHVTKSRNTGMGIWRLNKQKLRMLTPQKAIQEMRAGNYYADVSKHIGFTRQKQNEFRTTLLEQYEKCLFCGFTLNDYMIGSHIVPYHVMRQQEPENAMNPINGLLLCRMCDVAFEHGSIILEKDLHITIQSPLQDHNNTTVKSWLNQISQQVKIKDNVRHKPSQRYILWKKRLVTGH